MKFLIFLIFASLYHVETRHISAYPKLRTIQNFTSYEGQRIVNGVDASITEFPFQVSLRFVTSYGHTCGGSILTQRHILTAGHCVHNGDLFVVVGTEYLDHGGRRHNVANVTRHRDYDPTNYWTNDVAILTLSSSIEFNEFAQPVSLPSHDLQGGERVSISGWGLNSNGKLPNRLQKLTDWPVVNLDLCRWMIGYYLFEGELCAGGVGGKGICSGDSGGPLSNDGVIYGIASWIFSPCGRGLPEMYTRVHYYVNWIVETLDEDASLLKFA